MPFRLSYAARLLCSISVISGGKGSSSFVEKTELIVSRVPYGVSLAEQGFC